MSRAQLVVAAWATWLTALAVLLVAWTPSDYVEWIPIAAAAAGSWAIALVLVVRRRPRPLAGVTPAFSPGAVLAALGLAALAQGSALGVWLAYLGAGMLVVGLGAVVRETLAVRRERRV